MNAGTEILDALHRRLTQAAEIGDQLNLNLLPTTQLVEYKKMTLVLYDALRLVGAYLEELEKERQS